MTASLLAVEFAVAAEGDSQTYRLRSARQVGRIDRVTTVLEVQGDEIGKLDPQEKSRERIAVSVSCRREYDEKTLELPRQSPLGRSPKSPNPQIPKSPLELPGQSPGWRAVRYYHEAAATVQEGQTVQKPLLRSDRHLICLEIAALQVTPFCPQGPLNLDELELVSAPGNSLALDELLPAGPVAVGQKWQASDQVMGVLLDLEAVTANSVEIVLKEVTPEIARLELEGRVEGTLYGAAHQIDLKAKCRFDRRTERIDWFAMRVKQTQDVGLVERGMDVTVLVQIKIAPQEASEPLADAALAGLPLRPTRALRMLQYESPAGGWRMLHDRSWFLIEHYRDLDVFRRVDAGRDLALCRISLLPNVEPGRRISLERFQADVQEALGKNFGQFLQADERVDSGGKRILRLVVKGTDGDVPARWHYYHLSDERGHQAALAFRIEQKRLEAFGAADEPLVASLRFVGKD
jgi:hypothetical protein